MLRDTENEGEKAMKEQTRNDATLNLSPSQQTETLCERVRENDDSMISPPSLPLAPFPPYSAVSEVMNVCVCLSSY